MGRERRRKGPINRVRRFLYGVLLLAAAPGAAPADELAYVGKFRIAPVAGAATHADLVTLQGLLMLCVNEAEEPDVTLDAVTAQLADGAGPTPQYRIAAVRTGHNRFGARFELPVDALGEFRLSLLAQRSPVLAAWSLGGTLELVRITGETFAAAVPELRVQELHPRELRYLAFAATLRRIATDAPRLDFRWRI